MIVRLLTRISSFLSPTFVSMATSLSVLSRFRTVAPNLPSSEYAGSHLTTEAKGRSGGKQVSLL